MIFSNKLVLGRGIFKWLILNFDGSFLYIFKYRLFF